MKAARLTAAELRQVDELAGELRTVRLGGPAPLERAMAGLRELLEAEEAVVYALEPTDDGMKVDLLLGSGFQVAVWRRELDGWLRGRPLVGWSGYNPLLPEPWQRNRVVARDRIVEQHGRTPEIARSLFPRLGVAASDQLRALVCDGPALLAWVGAFRHRPFGGREHRILARLIPEFQGRLRLDRQLRQAALAQAAIEASLEHIPAAAFLVDARGRVRLANAAGRARLDAQPRETAETLAAALAPGAQEAATGLRITRVEANGLPPHFLVVDGQPAELEPRLARACARFGLTGRQREILGWLARGHSNKTIAALAGCAESTVELHVSAILERAQADSRAQLIARLWLDD